MRMAAATRVGLGVRIDTPLGQAATPFATGWCQLQQRSSSRSGRRENSHYLISSPVTLSSSAARGPAKKARG